MTAGNYLINFAAIGLAIGFLIIFWMLYRGRVAVAEPRRWILVTGQVLMVAIIGLAFYNLSSFLFAW